MDETPKGWYIQYIDRDPETIRRQQEQERKKKQDLDDEEKTAKFIEQQVRRGLEGKELVSKIACVSAFSSKLLLVNLMVIYAPGILAFVFPLQLVGR